MIQAIKNFFESFLDPEAAETEQDQDHVLQLATAALLIEVMRADTEVKSEEQIAVEKAIREKFDLSEEETRNLVQLAEQKADRTTSYYEFTSLINNAFTLDKKIKIIEMMWRVAFADNEMEKYEEHFIRKIAELLYVPHQDFIAAKLRAQASQR
jgi:uncharacterized tellurite resistance protein B-like protein